jgi:ParB family transcriptional regulator, chromosome partitioning protein
MTADKPRRLGRGLEALLASSASPSATQSEEQNSLQHIPVGEIRPNPYQPRKEFGAEELADLETSLRTSGLLQPITVRPAPDGRGYELIAGERRLRAAARLQWKEIPALVRSIDERTLLTLALVENLQRADLNPLEEAEGYQRLIDQFELTQQEVADVVGKDRSTVANMLRLLQLPASVRHMLQEAQLTIGHARALLALANERSITDLAREIVAKGLTVREVERRARAMSGAKAPPRATPYADPRAPEARRIEEQLRRRLQTDVEITLSGKDKGAIRISFYSADDLERVLDLVLGATREPL